jgi:hypothetical protein
MIESERVGGREQNNTSSHEIPKFSSLRMEERYQITSNIQKDCGWFGGEKKELQFYFFLKKTS